MPPTFYLPPTTKYQASLKNQSPDGWFPSYRPQEAEYGHLTGFVGCCHAAAPRILTRLLDNKILLSQKEYRMETFQRDSRHDVVPSRPYTRVLLHFHASACMLAIDEDACSWPTPGSWISFSQAGSGVDDLPIKGLKTQPTPVMAATTAAALFTLAVIKGESRGGTKYPFQKGVAAFSRVEPGAVHYDARFGMVMMDWMVFVIETNWLRLYNGSARSSGVLDLEEEDAAEVYLPAIRLRDGHAAPTPILPRPLEPLSHKSYLALDALVSLIMKTLLSIPARGNKVGEGPPRNTRGWRWVPLSLANPSEVLVLWKGPPLLTVPTGGLTEGSAFLTYQHLSKDTYETYGFEVSKRIPFGMLGSQVALRCLPLPTVGVERAMQADKLRFRQRAATRGYRKEPSYLLQYCEVRLAPSANSAYPGTSGVKGMWPADLTWLRFCVKMGTFARPGRGRRNAPETIISVPVIAKDQSSPADDGESGRDQLYELAVPGSE